MKRYLVSVLAVLIGFFAQAATYYTVPTSASPNVGWSLTQNGAPCNCGPNLNAANNNFSDTLVIFHDVSIPNLDLISGALVIVKPGATFGGSWSFMKIQSGARIQLESGSTFDPNVNVELRGELTGTGTVETGWDFEVMASGEINLSAGSTILANDFKINGTVTIDGDIQFLNDSWTIDGTLNVWNGNFSKSGGDMKVDGTLNFDGNTFDVLGDFRVRNSGVASIIADTATMQSGDFIVNEDLSITAHYTSITNGDLDIMNNASFIVNSKLYIANMDIMNHELFTMSDSVWMSGSSFETKNNSITQFDGYVFGASTSGLEYKGDIIVNDVMDLEVWFDLDEIGGGDISGCGIIDFNANQPWQLPAPSLRLNGVVSPLSYITFLGANGSSCGSNTVWYYDGIWSSSPTSCSQHAVVMSDLNLTGSHTVGFIKVKKGVKFRIKNGAYINICGNIDNEGEIRVETGGTLVIEGN